MLYELWDNHESCDRCAYKEVSSKMTTGWKLLLQQKAATTTEEDNYRFFFLNPEEKPVPYNVLLLPTEKELPKMLAKIDSINQNGNALWTHYLKKCIKTAVKRGQITVHLNLLFRYPTLVAKGDTIVVTYEPKEVRKVLTKYMEIFKKDKRAIVWRWKE